MASIIKRRTKFSVVYRYIDENGVERQKWETFSTNAEAKKRKKEIEYKQDNQTFMVPSCKTIRELLHDYVTIYGINTWAASTYTHRRCLIDHYINPYIGDLTLDKCTTRVMDKYYLNLLDVASRSLSKKRDKTTLSAQRIHDINKLLKSVFNQAIKWELMQRNPAEHVTLPQFEKKKRAIWTTDILAKAIKHCEDDRLALCLHLGFACTLRIGEVLGLTWDCIDISDESIENGTSYIYIDKELQRIGREAASVLKNKDIHFRFPCVKTAGTTILVLKKPKTDSSIRRIYLPATVAKLLQEHKKEQEQVKEYLGCDYHDYNLVITSADGRPVEGQMINRSLSDLIDKYDLPKVSFHSLRHTSVTHKLKLNGGDIKAVQGDSGHAQINMITDTYSHIIDEDRCKNAKKLENDFYSTENESDQRKTSTNTSSLDAAAQLMELLSKSPELAQILLKGLSNS